MVLGHSGKGVWKSHRSLCVLRTAGRGFGLNITVPTVIAGQVNLVLRTTVETPGDRAEKKPGALSRTLSRALNMPVATVIAGQVKHTRTTVESIYLARDH